MAELALDDPNRVFDFGTHAGLELLDFVDQRVDLVGLVQRSPHARPHGNMPVHTGYGVRTFGRPLVARVGEHVALLPMQQAVGLHHIVDVARRATHRVHQARVGVHPEVGLHPEEPLIAILALVHLEVSLAVLVFRRTRRCDQRGIDHRAGFQQQALAAQQIFQQRQDLVSQLALLQQMPESKNSALVGKPAVRAKAGELPERGHVMKRLSHSQVQEREPLLHEMDV